MPRIDITKTEGAPLIKSAIICGASRSGKTTFCATFPRVAWIGSLREGGFESIRFMDKTLLYERDHPPIVYAVNGIPDVNQAFGEIARMITTGEVRTVVFELSFYSDDVIQSLTGPDERNGWAKYQTLEQHIKIMDGKLKQLPTVRVIYNALEAPGEAKAPGTMMLAGKALGRKMPAAMDLYAYLRVEETNGKIERVLHLAPYGNFTCGHRYGAALPDYIRNPTFRKLEDVLSGRGTVDKDGNVVIAPPMGVKKALLPPLVQK
jgi:hypothetical protein